jgi:hypothetical protein
VTTSTIDAETGESDFAINVIWPYESGDDISDTTWGNNAYTYKSANPDQPSITMKVKLSVVQHV